MNQCMYSTAYAKGCETNVTLETRWSPKSNNQLSMTANALPSKGGGGQTIVYSYPN